LLFPRPFGSTFCGNAKRWKSKDPNLQIQKPQSRASAESGSEGGKRGASDEAVSDKEAMAKGGKTSHMTLLNQEENPDLTKKNPFQFVNEFQNRAKILL
jgi:hypothetical protein